MSLFKKKKQKDIFRPTYDPIALEIYDAFQDEAKKRPHEGTEWIENERKAVWETSKRLAKERGLREPTLDIIEQKESYACGHVDYGKQWAVSISEWMQKN